MVFCYFWLITGNRQCEYLFEPQLKWLAYPAFHYSQISPADKVGNANTDWKTAVLFEPKTSPACFRGEQEIPPNSIGHNKAHNNAWSSQGEHDERERNLLAQSSVCPGHTQTKKSRVKKKYCPWCHQKRAKCLKVSTLNFKMQQHKEKGEKKEKKLKQNHV